MANSARTSAPSAFTPRYNPATAAESGRYTRSRFDAGMHKFPTLAAYRGFAYSEFSLEVSGQSDFQEVIHAWKGGFDDAPHAAGSIGEQDAPANDLEMADLCDDIDCAISVLRDLLALARHECPTGADDACKAESAIRAAGRYVDDIEALNARLYARQAAAIQAEMGGAA